MAGRLKVATFTLHADLQQSVRWKRAADAEGHRSVGTWLAAAADAYLRVRAKAGFPMPLAWQRGVFTARLMDGQEIRVQGMVSPPFGCFEGTYAGPDRNHGPRTLVYLPSGRIVATLRTSRQARALASEIAPALLRDELPELAPVVERHVRESA
jgi:hypothetical protein